MKLNFTPQVHVSISHQTMDVHLNSQALPARRALIPAMHQRAHSPDLMIGSPDSLSFWNRFAAAGRREWSWSEATVASAPAAPAVAVAAMVPIVPIVPLIPAVGIAHSLDDAVMATLVGGDNDDVISVSQYGYPDDSSDPSEFDLRIDTPASWDDEFIDESRTGAPTPPRILMARRASAPSIPFMLGMHETYDPRGFRRA